VGEGGGAGGCSNHVGVQFPVWKAVVLVMGVFDVLWMIVSFREVNSDVW